jgi:ribonucleotide reductase beta subunit family protein with ferritin-like domain
MDIRSIIDNAVPGGIIDHEPLLVKHGIASRAVNLSLFPITFAWAWEAYKKMQSSVWFAGHVDFTKDVQQLALGEIPKPVLRSLKPVLGLFSGTDKIVNENLALNLVELFPHLEIGAFYAWQMANEVVHMETYAVTIDTYFTDPEEKREVQQAVETMKSIGLLGAWAQKWISRTVEDELRENRPQLEAAVWEIYKDRESDSVDVRDTMEVRVRELAAVWRLAKLLVAFACIEGVVFSSAFCFIFWCKEHGYLPGLTFSNEYISRDEGLHRDFACMLFKELKHLPPHEQVLDIVRDCMAFEEEFVREMLPEPLVGLNADTMTLYAKFVADSLTTNLGYEPIYGVANPFAFMEKTAFNSMTNFFEKKVSEYSKPLQTEAVTADVLAEDTDDF